MLPAGPRSLHRLALALVFALGFGAAAPAVSARAIPESIKTDTLPEEDDCQKESSLDKSAAPGHRRTAPPTPHAVRPDGARHHSRSVGLSRSATSFARPSAALNNGLSAHYRC